MHNETLLINSDEFKFTNIRICTKLNTHSMKQRFSTYAKRILSMGGAKNKNKINLNKRQITAKTNDT